MSVVFRDSPFPGDIQHCYLNMSDEVSLKTIEQKYPL